MPRVIQLSDGKVETLFSERDFVELVDKYMGTESAQFVRERFEELADYREQEDS